MFVISNLEEVVTTSNGKSKSINQNNTSKTIMSSTSFNSNNANNTKPPPSSVKSSSKTINNSNANYHQHQKYHQYNHNRNEETTSTTQQGSSSNSSSAVVGLFNTGMSWSDLIETSSTTTETTSVSTSTVAASVLNSTRNAVSDYFVGSGGEGGGEDGNNNGAPSSPTSSRNNNTASRPSLGLLSSMFSSQRSGSRSSTRSEYYLGRMMGVSEGNLLYSNSNNKNEYSPTSTKRTKGLVGSSMNNMTELVPMSFTLDDFVIDNNVDGSGTTSTTFEYFDPTKGDVIGNALMAYTMNNQWQKVKQNLERVCNTGSCTEERLYYVKIISTTIAKSWPINNVNRDTRLSPMLDKWKQFEPANVDCLLIRAETYLEWAWHVRSINVGLFISRLRLCANEMQEAQLFRPDDPLIYAIGINLAKALGREWGENNVMTVEECLSALSPGGIASAPPSASTTSSSNGSDVFESYLYTAHIDALYSYCEATTSPWQQNKDGDGYSGDDGGVSHKEQAILAYARNVSSNLPIGHPLWMIIPLAHYECQRQRQMSIKNNSIVDNNMNRKKKPPPNSTSSTASSTSSSSSSSSSQQYDYWKQRDVVEEIAMAYQNAFPSSSSSSSSSSAVGGCNNGIASIAEETRTAAAAAIAARKRRPYAKKIEWTCRNYFAYALTKCRQKDLARQQIRIIGRRPIDGNPWRNIKEYKTILKQDLKFEF